MIAYDYSEEEEFRHARRVAQNFDTLKTWLSLQDVRESGKQRAMHPKGCNPMRERRKYTSKKAARGYDKKRSALGNYASTMHL